VISAIDFVSTTEALEKAKGFVNTKVLEVQRFAEAGRAGLGWCQDGEGGILKL